jgi:hypothetical protein
MSSAKTTSGQQASESTVGSATKTHRKRSKVKRALLAILVVMIGYAAYDLFGPRSTRMRSFDPDKVARLEAAMWRSYYAKERLKLYAEMTELLQTQYNLPFVRSNAVAYQASRAAFVFKDGHNRTEYEKALPYLVNFYSAIRKVSDIAFDVNRAAELELEWWIVHRERKSHDPGDLDRALAQLPAEIYGIPSDRLMGHARLRAQAMTIRDAKAGEGGVTEQDWAKIDELLHSSWRSLWQAVNS